jgi:hypothetical protein
MDWNEWIGKKVLILKKDGYKRICYIKDASDSLLQIQLLNGQIEMLATSSIENIKELK